jgi:tetratricopeptide (TPR) repeat protein
MFLHLLKNHHNEITAISTFYKELKLAPSETNDSIAQGIEYQNQGKFDEAITAFTNALKLAPGRVNVYIFRGTVYQNQSKFDEAITDFTKAIELTPEKALAYNNRGAIYYLQNRLDLAITDFEEALKQDPKFALAYNNLGIIDSDQEKYDEAIVKYKKALKIEPTCATHNNCGIAYQAQGRLNKAIAEYKKALKINPSFVLIYNSLGNAYRVQKKLNKAIAAYKKALKIDPTFILTYNNLGIAYKTQEKFDKAIDVYNKALELDPKNIITIYNKRVVLEITKNKFVSPIIKKAATDIVPKESDQIGNNPLIKAILSEDFDEVLFLLKQGYKLATTDLPKVFNHNAPNNTHPEILHLLDKYKALPKNISVSTLKFILYLLGNKNIGLKDFLNEFNLNLNGCAELMSPMRLAVRGGIESMVEFLIAMHVQERPLHWLFLIHSVHKSNFTNLDILDICGAKNNIADFKCKIVAIFSTKNMQNKCKIAELFIKNPTSALYSAIEADSDQFLFMPFFAWAAMNNRSELFDNNCFKKLVAICPEVAAQSLKIAILFGAKNYVVRAIYSLGTGVIKPALLTAVISEDLNILKCVVHSLSQFKLTLRNISININRVLFSAVRLENLKLVTYLLKKGMNPNIYDSEGSTLHLAVRLGNIKLIELLINKNAQIDCNNSFNKITPLHEAILAKQWHVAVYLVNNFGADIHIKDKKGKTALDYIDDEELKEKLFLEFQKYNIQSSEKNSPSVSDNEAPDSPLLSLSFLKPNNEVINLPSGEPSKDFQIYQ